MKDYLKPRKAYLNLYYQCTCGHDIYVSSREAQKIGKVCCEFCQKIVKFEPIADIRVKIYYKRKSIKEQIRRYHIEPTKPEEVEKPKINNNANFTDIINSLVSMGYKKREASKLVEKAIFILGKNTSDEEILRKSIELVK